VRAQAELNLASAYASFAEVETEAEPPVEMPAPRGRRQAQITELLTGVEAGLTSAAIAAEIGGGYAAANAHDALQSLERAGIVELVAGVHPITWRLAPRYQRNGRVFARVASRIREGEWATYGDVSVAVTDDTRASRGVGSAARRMPDFPHPERLLKDGGVIHPNWLDAAGRGPEHARQLLESQGVRFSADGLADPEQRVSAKELRRRDEVEPVTWE
jgi:alkylated DNA nucleotide flippase Atl1